MCLRATSSSLDPLGRGPISAWRFTSAMARVPLNSFQICAGAGLVVTGKRGRGGGVGSILFGVAGGATGVVSAVFSGTTSGVGSAITTADFFFPQDESESAATNPSVSHAPGMLIRGKIR
jgi:hypothetical protein